MLPFAALLLLSLTADAGIPALIIDGQNNHDFRATTPHLQKLLEETGLFTVEIATAPRKGESMSNFRPSFEKYRVLISNYNGEAWPKATQEAFTAFVRNGGGFVSVHAADNSFPDWKEYNEMIGLGGWGERDESSGPYLRLRDGRFVQNNSPGKGGSHGKQHEFVLETRAPQHPIMRGLPAKWMHARDELYDRLRGPARNVLVLASAFSSKESGGSGEHEPLLMAVSYGKGRVFHTALGHNNGKDITSQKCVGFIVTFQRGVEWAATGNVMQKLPLDFPTADTLQLRD